MQSVLQYRRIGQHVRTLLAEDGEKRIGSWHEPDAPALDRDAEKLQPAPPRRSSSSSSSTASPSISSTAEPASPSSSPDEAPRLAALHRPPLGAVERALTNGTQHTERTRLGLALPGVYVRARTAEEGEGGLVFVVGWEGPGDPLNPHRWSTARRVVATLLISSVAFTVGAASSIDSAVLPQASRSYGVSEVAGSLITGIYLIGFAVGSLFAGSFSETFGRNIVYIATMLLFMVFMMASALAPNYGASVAFRFLAGFFGSTPLVCSGGTVADLWDPLEATFGFPLFAIPGFGGPMLGPVIGSYVGQGVLGWHWAEWLVLILAGLVLAAVVLLQPETYGPLLLTWKAAHLRRLTGDARFRSPMEIVQTGLGARLRRNVYRPFAMVATEPIVVVIALYLTILYIVLFTFFDGFPAIFQDTYGISQGLTNIVWLSVFVGVVSMFALVPGVYKWTKTKFHEAQERGEEIRPEVRLCYANVLGGSLAIPISLFWIGWTANSDISIWSPIIGTALFGYGTITIFTSSYMYLIEVYRVWAASALAFGAFARYLAAGGMTVVGVPMYDNLGVHYTLTVLGCISAAMVPAPFILYYYGHVIRRYSKHAQNRI